MKSQDRKLPGSKILMHTLLFIVGYALWDNLSTLFVSTPASLFVIMFVYYQTMYWGTSLVCEMMDKKCSPSFRKSHKLASPGVEPSWSTMWPTVLTNQLIQIVVVGCLTWMVRGYFDHSPLGGLWDATFGPSKETNLAFIFISLVAQYVIFDVFFYWCHVGMHRFPFVFKAIHQTHHSTFATSGLSGHYMDFLDFVGESIIPFGACVVFGALLGLAKVSFISAAGIGAFNVVWVHGGWDIEGLPCPKQHFLHHTQYTVNLGIGLFDTLCGTRK